MRIVDVNAFYSPHGGGVKTYVEQKMRIGPELGVEVIIVAPGDRHEVIEYGPGSRVVIVPGPHLPFDKNYWYFGDEPALHKVLDELKPDLVEVASPWRSPSWVANWQRANGQQVPLSLFMHADPMAAYAYRWLSPALSRPLIDRLFATYLQHLRRLDRQYASVIAGSKEFADRLTAGGMTHVELNPLGVDEGVFGLANRDPAVRAALLADCGLPESAGLLIGVARLAPEKRWPMVIDGVRLASRERPLGLIILGQGRLEAKIRAQIGADPQIRLLAPVRVRPKFAAMLASADAFVHGSDSETYGLAAAEARASGVPVIVPDLGAALDHAADDGGVTYRSADPKSLAIAIGKLAAQGWPRSHATSRTMRAHFVELFAHYRELIAAHKA